MIRGFIVSAITDKGEQQIKINSKIPLQARVFFKKKVISKYPYAVKFLFVGKAFLRLFNIKDNTKENLEKALMEEMVGCVRNKDYTLEVLV